MRTRSFSYALLALIAATACKSSESNSDASATACGDAVCPAGVLCVSKQNCDSQACDPVPDSGVCPPGTTATASCHDGGPPGCHAGCPAPQYACEARPAGCDPLGCACAASLCAPGTCLAAMNARVACTTR